MSLLRVASGDGHDVLPSWQGRPKPGCHGKNHEVGTRADGSRHFICPSNGHQSQVLADFVAEWTEIQMPPAVIDQEYWTMYFDGSLMKKDVGMGLVFVSPLGVRMRYMVHLHFPSSNNVAEYEALINSLRIAIELGIRWLDVQGDTQLVIDQVMKKSSYHNAKMAMYC